MKYSKEYFTFFGVLIIFYLLFVGPLISVNVSGSMNVKVNTSDHPGEIFELSIDAGENLIVLLDKFLLSEVIGFYLRFYNNSNDMSDRRVSRYLYSTISVTVPNLSFDRIDESTYRTGGISYLFTDLHGFKDMTINLTSSYSEAVNFYMTIEKRAYNPEPRKSYSGEMFEDMDGGEVTIAMGKTISCCSDTPIEGYLGANANLTIYMRNYSNQTLNVLIQHSIIKVNEEETSIDTIMSVTLEDNRIAFVDITLPQGSEYSNDKEYNWLSRLLVEIKINSGDYTSGIIGLYTIVNNFGEINPNLEIRAPLSTISIIFALISVSIIVRKRKIRVN